MCVRVYKKIDLKIDLRSINATAHIHQHTHKNISNKPCMHLAIHSHAQRTQPYYILIQLKTRHHILVRAPRLRYVRAVYRR